MPRSSKQRLLRLICSVCVVGLLGGAYALICTYLGYGIPCLFHTLTGLQCPGCGISRMCLCLVRLDFSGAWAANPALFALLPFVAVLAVRLAVRYVKSGSRKLTKAENILTYTACAILLVFGVVRNL